MKLSFVIVEYHSVEDILACSSSIQENMEKTSYQFEIIVSSNSLYNSEKRKQLLAVHSKAVFRSVEQPKITRNIQA